MSIIQKNVKTDNGSSSVASCKYCSFRNELHASLNKLHGLPRKRLFRVKKQALEETLKEGDAVKHLLQLLEPWYALLSILHCQNIFNLEISSCSLAKCGT
ncbi:hypothetical protein GOODEAATRI_012176 [Goodea atripinnis]|uniref:Uncharacterized protein n=1 Tax=Goodea atripinnis TaxID=208336 RepID=A0ABV0P537_9TELE